MLALKKRNILILGAAGRDFHNFLVRYKNDKNCRVVGFTATQIPGIGNKPFPAVLAGKNYPKGIRIYPEEKLEELIAKLKVDECVFSYSDVSHEYVMHLASRALACGASFSLLGPKDTMLKSKKPVISVCAVRTGSGKSQTSRALCELFARIGVKVAVVRHPMPYKDLARQAVQRFSSYNDFGKADCTIEEREEYERYVEEGIAVYAGVDYEKILRRAEAEADLILWDGGNNDFAFFKPDLQIVVADPHRAGHELLYHPGEANFRMADIILINKTDSAPRRNVKLVEKNAKKVNPKAKIIRAKSVISVQDSEKVGGKSVIVVEDGPTTTHGGMAFGAGTLAAKRLGCKIIDPKPFAVGSIRKAFQKFPHLKMILPAMGYSKRQISELERTINRAKCSAVMDGTPINLKKLLKVNKPVFDARYELDDSSRKKIFEIIGKRFGKAWQK